MFLSEPMLTVSGKSSRVLHFLKQESGQKTILGIHNDLKSGSPSTWTDRAFAITGKYPALWSGDFLFDERAAFRWEMIYEAERQWRAGAIINLMWHACPPVQNEPCAWEGGILSHLSDREWQDLVTEGGALNRVWKNRMDALVPYLGYLAERNIEVLWRPLHEMNQSNFWWGGRPGAGGSSLLYRITFEYLTKTRGITNLVWTWDVQDLRFDWEEYYPGAEYFDVMALDNYEMGFTEKVYESVQRLAGDKPFGIGEVAKLPSPDVLARQQDYRFVMGWSDLPFKNNTELELCSLFHASNVVTRESMPGWGQSV